MGDQSLHCRNGNFRPFPLLWPWPWPDDLYIRTWPVHPRDTPDVQIWTFYESLTDIQTDKLRVVTFGHVTKMAVTPFNPSCSRKPHATCKPHGAIFYRIRVMFIDLDLDPMIFIYELDPYSQEIYRMCKYELPKSRPSKVIVWQTYRRHTYRQTERKTNRIDQNYKPRRFAVT